VAGAVIESGPRTRGTGMYKIEQPQWIFCLRRSREGGAMWSDGVRTIELEEFNIVYCINGRLEANDGKGGLYLILT
jgi:hypothetical protein